LAGKRANLLISLLILAAFVLILIRYEVFASVRRIVENLNPHFVLISLILYSSTYIFRALRFKLFFNIEISKMFSVMCVHTFFNNVLPFRSGESSFPIILKKLFEIPLTQSSTALLIARIFDLLTLAVLFLISLTSLNAIRGWLVLFPVSLLLAILSLLLLSYRLLWKLRRKHSVLEALFSFVNSYVSGRNLLLTMIYSLTTWFLKFSSFFFILKAAGIDIDFLKTVFVSTFGEATTILPVHSIGGFGTYEGGLVGGFSLAGMDPKIALSISLYFHSTLLLMSFILSVAGWYFLSRHR